WNVGSNWVGGVKPATNGFAFLSTSAVANEPTLTGNNTITGLYIKAGRTLTLGSGNTLSVTAIVNNNATITGTGTLALTGGSSQNITGTGSISNLTLNNNSGAVIAA